MATENLIMAMVSETPLASRRLSASDRLVQVAAGGNRQECHEKIRTLSQKAAERVKIEGLDNDLVERVKNEPYFAPIVAKLDVLLDARTFIGRAPEQVYQFISTEVEPTLKSFAAALQSNNGKAADLAV